jgi:hypothetical protein
VAHATKRRPIRQRRSSETTTAAKPYELLNESVAWALAVGLGSLALPGKLRLEREAHAAEAALKALRGDSLIGQVGSGPMSRAGPAT